MNKMSITAAVRRAGFSPWPPRAKARSRKYQIDALQAGRSKACSVAKFDPFLDLASRSVDNNGNSLPMPRAPNADLVT
jgi:hypothetical protein